jgi:hypothetical protein
MRMSVDLPSAAAGGVLVALAMSARSLPPMVLDYGAVEAIPFTAGAVALGAVLLAARRLGGGRPLQRSEVNQALKKRFPSGWVLGADDTLPPTPVEWLGKVAPRWRSMSRSELDAKVHEAMAAQVGHAVHPVVLGGLGAALRVLARTGDRQALRDIAGAMLETGRFGKAFDLPAFLDRYLKRYPWMREDEGEPQSRYPLVHLLNELRRARDKAGIVPASEFAWVRALDPLTWQTLNHLDSTNAPVECVGVLCHRAHWKAPFREETPEVTAAVSAFFAELDRRGLVAVGPDA